MEELTVSELKRMIYISGFHLKEYTDHIGRSAGYIDNVIAQKSRIVPPRFIVLLKSMLGDEIFDYSFKKILKRREEIEIKRQKRLSG